MGDTMRNLVLAQAVSELAALLEYKQHRDQATVLRDEATVLARGRGARGLEEIAQLNRIRGGIQTMMNLDLSPDEQIEAATVALRIERALHEN